MHKRVKGLKYVHCEFLFKTTWKNILPIRIKAPTDFLKIIFLRSSYRTCSWNPWRQKSFDLTSSFLRQHLRSFGRNSFNHSSHFKKNSPLRSSLFLAIWWCSSFHIAFVFRWCSGLLLVLCPGLRDHLWCWWSNLGSVRCKVSALSPILPDTVNFYAIPFLPHFTSLCLELTKQMKKPGTNTTEILVKDPIALRQRCVRYFFTY